MVDTLYVRCAHLSNVADIFSVPQESANPPEAGILLVIGRLQQGVRSDPLIVPFAAAVRRGVPT